MLIIFDLDDTLIDTSGCITHYKLEDALRLMINEGLDIPDFVVALDLLRRLNSAAESARAALAEFIEILGADTRLLPLAIQEVYENISPELPIFPLEGALDLLALLSQHHQLALVTMGSSLRQMEKLKKAGIDSQIFSKIAVCQERDKKPHYQLIVEELGYAPSNVLVCGDRFELDLIPARELGYKTVQMQWGRGWNSRGSKGDADYCIFKLYDLKNIIDDLMAISSF